jgi:hypothetical protein
VRERLRLHPFVKLEIKVSKGDREKMEEKRKGKRKRMKVRFGISFAGGEEPTGICFLAKGHVSHD